MRILSIDLPWSESGVYGFAFADLDGSTRAVSACEVREKAHGVGEVFRAFAREQRGFDVILVDHPIGEGGAPLTDPLISEG